LDAWIQHQAKIKLSSDTKYDVKVDGKWIPKPNLTPKKTKTQDWPRPKVARTCLGARVPHANLLPQTLEGPSFARFESFSSQVDFLTF